MNKLSFVLLWATLLALAFGSGSADGFFGSKNSREKNGRHILMQETLRNDVMGKIGAHVYSNFVFSLLPLLDFVTKSLRTKRNSRQLFAVVDG